MDIPALSSFPLLRGRPDDLTAIVGALELLKESVTASLVVPLFWGGNVSVGAGSSFYFGPTQGGAAEVAAQAPAPRRLVVGDLRAQVTPAPGGSSTVTFTFRVNGQDTPLAAVVSGTNVAAEDLEDGVLVDPGDLLSLRMHVGAGAATVTSVRLSFNAALHIL